MKKILVRPDPHVLSEIEASTEVAPARLPKATYQVRPKTTLTKYVLSKLCHFNERPFLMYRQVNYVASSESQLRTGQVQSAPDPHTTSYWSF